MARVLRIQNDFLALRKMSAWLEEAGVALHLPAPQRFEFDLVANEAVTNIISYGYPGGRAGEIKLSFGVTHGVVSLEIEDDGRPFNPLEIEPRHAPDGLDDAEIGGLGIHLIRMTMAECEYRVRVDRNVFTLRSPLADEQSTEPKPAVKKKG